MQSISIESELSVFDLDKRWNDYIGVQKEVLSVLRKENYFANGDIINLETGMHIRLTAKGIKETLGKGNKFQNLQQ